MKLEIKSASDFVADLLKLNNSQLSARQLQVFSANLQALLRDHYQQHWFPDQPNKGCGYRCIRINHKMDPLVAKAAEVFGVTDSSLVRAMFPSELTLWIDPREVSYRIGENGSICVLYESAIPAKNKSDSGPEPVTARSPNSTNHHVKNYRSSPVHNRSSPVIHNAPSPGPAAIHLNRQAPVNLAFQHHLNSLAHHQTSHHHNMHHRQHQVHRPMEQEEHHLRSVLRDRTPSPFNQLHQQLMAAGNGNSPIHNNNNNNALAVFNNQLLINQLQQQLQSTSPSPPPPPSPLYNNTGFTDNKFSSCKESVRGIDSLLLDTRSFTALMEQFTPYVSS